MVSWVSPAVSAGLIPSRALCMNGKKNLSVVLLQTVGLTVRNS